MHFDVPWLGGTEIIRPIQQRLIELNGVLGNASSRQSQLLSSTRKATSGVFVVPEMMRSSMSADVRMGRRVS